MKQLLLKPLLLFFCCILLGCQQQKPSDFLSDEELEWLEENGHTIRVSQDPRYPPLSFRDRNDNIIGISEDYLKIIEKRLDIHFIRLQEQNLEENLNAAKNKKVDLVTSIAQTPQRSQYLLFTSPYFETPAVIIVNGRNKQKISLSELTDKRVSVGKRFAVHDYLDNNYPELQLDPVSDDLAGLKKLVFNETDVLIADLASVSFRLEQSGIVNLHVAGNTDFVYQIAFGVRKDLPILRNILNKTLATISKTEQNKIRKKWIFLSTREFWERKNFWYWMGFLFIASSIGLFLIITFNKSLKLQVQKRTEELNQELKTRLKAEKSLRENEERYRIVAGQEGQFVYDYDLVERSILWFGDLEHTTGYTQEEYNKFTVEDWERFIHPDDFDLANNTLNESIATGSNYEVIYRYQHKDGHYIPMLDKGTFLKDKDGIPYRMLGIISNISLQVQKEEQLRIAKQNAEKADQLKTQFLANMSHEIRTPMNGIMGFSSLLTQADVPKEKQNTYCKLILQSSQYLQKIIDDILDTSLIESGQLKTYLQPVSLNQTIQAVLQYFDTNDKVKQGIVQIKSNLGLADGEDLLETDEIRLKQILINLVGNAFKYTHQGHIRIKYSLEKADHILFQVNDTGIGISQDQLEHIFERFRQAETANGKKYGGTGLGLAISKGLVELLGGEIWCESEVGQGTTFFFTLPYSKSK